MNEAIKELYAAFAVDRLPTDHDACPHCVSPEDKRRLYARPLRELSADDLDRYVWSAMTTWGDAALFRHFLPRILELMCTHQFLWDPEILGEKLRYAEWSKWEAQQQTAVGRFFTAWWRGMLRSEVKEDTDPDAFLCMVACSGLSLEPYLSAWRDEDSLPATCLLADMLLPGEWPEMSSVGYGPWWKSCAEQGKEFRNWLICSGWDARLEREALAHAGEKWSEGWMRAAEMLRAEANR